MKHYSEYGFNEEIYVHFDSMRAQLFALSAGITFPDPNYNIIRKNSPHFSIEYVYSGSGVVHHGSQVFNVSAGDFFILYPSVYHHYYSNKNDPFKKIFLTVNGDPTFLNTLLKLYKVEGIIHLKGTNSPFQLENMLALIKEDKSDISHELEVLILKMVADISDFVYRKNYYNNKIEICKSLIERRITTKISVSELCNYVHLERSYFCRAFKKETGLSPSMYITLAKIEYAMKLLTGSNLSINQISDNLFFTDTAHFIHRFQKYTGFSPNDYRRIFRDNAQRNEDC